MLDAAQRAQRMALIESFDKARILCVGDIMLDRFVYGEVSRISPEAPIPVMKRSSEQMMLGGAGNVVRNIASLGASCCFISVIGDDATGHTLTKLAGELERLEPYLITDSHRRSSEKTRFVCSNQQLLRCDEEDTSPISAASEQKLLNLIEQSLPECDVLILSDYAKGVLTENVIRRSIDLAKHAQKPVFVDPKHTDITLYRGASLLSPNLKELKAFVPHENLADGAAIYNAAHSLCEANAIAAMSVTRGKDGISLIQSGMDAEHIKAEPREVFDVSGAGDTVIATLAVAHASGADLSISTELANLAAGIAVSRPGTATVYRTDLKAALHHMDAAASRSKLASLDMANAIVASWKEEGKTIGFTNGCFDLLHVGHLQSLQDAKSHCDRLVVAINSDESVKRLKGDSRPVNHEMDRADLLAGLGCVDLVVIFREDTPLAVLERLKPDFLMKGADYRKEEVVGYELVEAYGGQIVLLALKDGYSSTQLIEKTQKVS